MITDATVLATLISPNGEVDSIILPEDDESRLRQLHGIVGGYIEAVFPGGQHLAFIRTEGEHFVLPYTTELIALTPVSASGERGETLVLDGDEVDGDLVYIPCDITGRRPGAALWLLMPLAWIYAMGRRRRRCA